MKIRAITLFVEPTFEPSRGQSFFDAARHMFADQVQTLRLATTPFPSWWRPERFPAIQARESAELSHAVGAEFICLGPVLLRHDAGWLDTLPDIVGSGRGVHVAAEIADTGPSTSAAAEQWPRSSAASAPWPVMDRVISTSVPWPIARVDHPISRPLFTRVVRPASPSPWKGPTWFWRA